MRDPEREKEISCSNSKKIEVGGNTMGSQISKETTDACSGEDKISETIEEKSENISTEGTPSRQPEGDDQVGEALPDGKVHEAEDCDIKVTEEKTNEAEKCIKEGGACENFNKARSSPPLDEILNIKDSREGGIAESVKNVEDSVAMEIETCHSDKTDSILEANEKDEGGQKRNENVEDSLTKETSEQVKEVKAEHSEQAMDVDDHENQSKESQEVEKIDETRSPKKICLGLEEDGISVQELNDEPEKLEKGSSEKTAEVQECEKKVPVLSEIADARGSHPRPASPENRKEPVSAEKSSISTEVEAEAEAEDRSNSFVDMEKMAKIINDELNAKICELPRKTEESNDVAECLSNFEGTSYQVFRNKNCINYDCRKQQSQFYLAPMFAFSYYQITKKKNARQYICATCYDDCLEEYEDCCQMVRNRKPLLLREMINSRKEYVEISDSSDEETSDERIADGGGNTRGDFTKSELELIENELENSIRSVLNTEEVQNQFAWSRDILTARIDRNERYCSEIDRTLRSLQRCADEMYNALYQHPKNVIQSLEPVDLNKSPTAAGREKEQQIHELPPCGEVQYAPVQIEGIYYAVKNKAIASWVPCRIIEQMECHVSSAQKMQRQFKIRFLQSQYQVVKAVSAKHLAYYDPPDVRLPIGARVIAFFDATCLHRGKERITIQSAFYPGIIAEPLKQSNKYRYLIFYDDGYTQYVHHKDVRLVCSVAENVWEDVHQDSREFIRNYLTQYTVNRPMVQTQKGQSMSAESNGKWSHARVIDVDCSLVQMQFDGPRNHTEWIYRGSLRLGPVFKEYQKSLQKDFMSVSRLPRRTEPYIRYTKDEEAQATQPRAVAKKSLSRPVDPSAYAATSQQPMPPVRHLNNSTIYLEDENKPTGKVVYYTAKRNLPPKPFRRHRCSPACLFVITHNLHGYSPLAKPLLSGWERMIFRQKIKKGVAYRGPCGRIIRNMKELLRYLRETENVLNVDNFDFSPEISCLAEYVIESAIVQRKDISNGIEKMPIPLVNYYDNTMPPECKYAAQRIPTEGVNLNLDEDFLAGCDCDDDCSDKSKCSCWQLTYAGAKYGNPNTPKEEIGYQYKRLYEHVPTGIYECNSRCKCKSHCLNRVVQHSLQMKLQVFKTSNRGWGLRCINDVPRGSFICIYAGHLLTEVKANEGGKDAGDEYFAELDYIEVAEQIKEGYESDVQTEPEDDEDFLNPKEDDDNDDDFRPSGSYTKRSKLRGGGQSQQKANDEDSQERQVISFNPNAAMNDNTPPESSIRRLFGKDEACYVMDAKITGNLGRYFNHSCAPNLFVQNVFVDTHDLRFPWVAFFALNNIRAGTELTWNYNYEVGVVPGKVLYCQCGAPNCRLRLL